MREGVKFSQLYEMLSEGLFFVYLVLVRIVSVYSQEYNLFQNVLNHQNLYNDEYRYNQNYFRDQYIWNKITLPYEYKSETKNYPFIIKFDKQKQNFTQNSDYIERKDNKQSLNHYRRYQNSGQSLNEYNFDKDHQEESENFDNNRRQDSFSGQYHYIFGVNPLENGDKNLQSNHASSNFVGYSIKVKHPTISNTKYPDEVTNYFNNFSPKPNEFKQDIFKQFHNSNTNLIHNSYHKLNDGYNQNIFKSNHQEYYGQPLFEQNLIDINQYHSNNNDYIQPNNFITDFGLQNPMELYDQSGNFQNGKSNDLRPYPSDDQEIIAAINKHLNNNNNKLKLSNNKINNNKLNNYNQGKREEDGIAKPLQIVKHNNDISWPDLFSAFSESYSHKSQNDLYNLDDVNDEVEDSDELDDDEDEEEEEAQESFENRGKIKTITFTENVPIPVKVEKKVPVPIQIPVEKPYAVFIPKPVPVRVHKPIPFPVKIPIPKPYPVQKLVPVPIRVPVPRSFPVPIIKPYPVYVVRKVPFAVVTPRLYPIKVPIEKPVPYAIHYNKYVPVPVIKNIPVPVKLPVKENIKIDIEYEKPSKKPEEEFKLYAQNFKHSFSNYNSDAITLDDIYDDNEEDGPDMLNSDEKPIVTNSMQENAKQVVTYYEGNYDANQMNNSEESIRPIRRPMFHKKKQKYSRNRQNSLNHDDNTMDKGEYVNIMELQKDDMKPTHEYSDVQSLSFEDILKTSETPVYKSKKPKKIIFRSKYNRDKYNLTVDNDAKPSSDNRMKTIWRGSKRFMKKEVDYENMSDTSSSDASSEETPSFRSLIADMNDFGQKFSEKNARLLREMKSVRDKEDNDFTEEVSTQKTVSEDSQEQRSTGRRKYKYSAQRTAKN